MRYAVIENNVVINVVVSTQSNISVIEAAYPSSLIIRPTDTTPANTAVVGYFYKDNTYFVPYMSWTVDSSGNFVPPVPYPSDGNMYTWDESILNWIPFVPPTP